MTSRYSLSCGSQFMRTGPLNQRCELSGFQVLRPFRQVSARSPRDSPGGAFFGGVASVAALIDVTAVGGDHHEPVFPKGVVAELNILHQGLDMRVDSADRVSVLLRDRAVDVGGIVDIAAVDEPHVERRSAQCRVSVGHAFRVCGDVPVGFSVACDDAVCENCWSKGYMSPKRVMAQSIA